MCLLFYIPSLFWNYFCENVPDIDINSLVKIAEESKKSSNETRQTMAQQMASLIYDYFMSNRDFSVGTYSRCRAMLHKTFGIFFLSKRMGSRILGNYFLVKIIYIAVISLQLWMMSIVFGLNSTTIFDIFMESSEKIFPTRTVCHWPNINGQDHSYNGVCLLSWNIVYKYIFGMLWLFFIGLLCVNVASLLGCIWNNISCNRQAKIDKHFQLINLRQDNNDRQMEMFQKQFMNNDGIFLLSMFERISGKSMVEEILFSLWMIFESENPNTKEEDSLKISLI